MAGTKSETPNDLDATVKMPAIQVPTQPSTTLVQMPALGLRGLALELYPEDRDDQAKMQQHIQDLFALNADRLRNEDVHIVGQLVKIPAGA
jgi:hypothetical protein